MKLRRTLLTGGVFALLAMIYVPTPRYGYRFIFSQRDNSIAFFQLLVNVVFAALLGAILATIIPKIVTGVRKLPRWVLRGLTGTVFIIAVITIMFVCAYQADQAAQRARSDEEYAERLVKAWEWRRRRPGQPEAAYDYFRNAALNLRLALRFDEATRVENRIKELQKRAAQDWQSDPVVDLSGLPDQGPAQAPEASGARAPRPSPSPDISFDDLIPTNPNAGLTPIPRARPVRSPSPR
jgi:hypothetical protein